MRIINPEDSDKILESQISEINNCDDAINQFLKFYEAFKTKQRLEHKEGDMMLFQYGNWNWQDGNKKEFGFDLTRQFELPNEDEYLQLRLTLFYDLEQIGEIEPFNSWSVDAKNLKEWEQLIKRSDGYLKSKNLKPKRIEITSDKT